MEEPQRPFAYGSVEAGEDLRPVRVVVSRQAVRDYRYATDLLGEDYEPDWGPRAAPSLVLVNHLLRLPYATFTRPRGSALVHLREEMWLGRPPYVGEALTLTGHIEDVYEKKGRGRIVYRTAATADDGCAVLSSRHTMVEVKPASTSAESGSPGPGDSAERATAASGTILLNRRAAVGDRLPAVSTAPLRQDASSVFTGAANFDSIHVNAELAREHGLRTTIAQGLLAMAIVEKYVTVAFGPQFGYGGYLGGTFVRSWYTGDSLELCATVTEIDDTPRGRELTLDVAGLDVAGQLAVAAVARGWLP